MELADVVWRQGRVFVYQGDIVGRLVVQLLRQLFVVLDEMGHVNVAEVLFRQDILSYLVAEKSTLVQARQRIIAASHTGIRRHCRQRKTG
jgi:hypothetical protein